MPTLLLPPRYTDDSITLWRTAIGLGWDVIRVAGWRPPAGVVDPCVYGETMFVTAIADQLDLALLEPALDFLPGLPPELRRRDVTLTTLGAARALPGPIFVKAAQQKSFPAAVVDDGAALPTIHADDEPVLVSEVVRFDVEVRCLILEGEIVGSTGYCRAGEPATEISDAERGAALATAAAVLHAGPTPAAFILDVGAIAERGWAVVEANPASSAGFYDADPAAMLAVIARACRPRATLSDADRRWIR